MPNVILVSLDTTRADRQAKCICEGAVPMSSQHPTFLMLDVKGSTKVVQALSRQDYLSRVHEPVYAKLQALFKQYEGEMSGTPHGDDALVVFNNDILNRVQ